MMSEENNTSDPEAQPTEKKGFPLMLVILAVVLIWAVVAYFMAIESNGGNGDKAASPLQHTSQSSEQQSASVDESQPAEQSVSESVQDKAQEASAEVSETMADAAAKGSDAMKQIMDVFAPAEK
jgi:methyl-accepting chemotaxis protein